MATKCQLCNQKIETTVLGKIKGTYINKKPVCNNCQKKYGNKLKQMI